MQEERNQLAEEHKQDQHPPTTRHLESRSRGVLSSGGGWGTDSGQCTIVTTITLLKSKSDADSALQVERATHDTGSDELVGAGDAGGKRQRRRIG